MDSNYKYIWNMGLAFDEDRVLNKMSALVKEGWILKEMTLSKYKLEKAEPQELIYSMDYKELKDDTEEYFELFKSSGWNSMCSYGPYHFFSAPIGTIPIYTDRESYLEKYKASRNIYLKVLVFSSLAFLILTFINSFAADKINNKVFDGFILLSSIVSVAIAVPSLMVTIAYIIRLKKIYKLIAYI